MSLEELLNSDEGRGAVALTVVIERIVKAIMEYDSDKLPAEGITYGEACQIMALLIEEHLSIDNIDDVMIAGFYENIQEAQV